MELSLSRVHFPVTTLGPGRRLGIWFQGCSIRCPGCISADTWGPGRRRIALARLLADIQPWLEQATELGRARLGGYQRPLREDDKALDLMFDHDGSVWMAGIPRRDDLLRLQDLLREQGHQLSVSAHRPR